MPECMDCGNRREFTHFIEVIERRLYDEESGDFKRTTDVYNDSTMELWCPYCESHNIQFDT